MQAESLSRSPSPALSQDVNQEKPPITLSTNTSATSLVESEEDFDPSDPYAYECDIDIIKGIASDIKYARVKLPKLPLEQETAHKIQWRTCLHELMDKYDSEASTFGPLFMPDLDELSLAFITPEVYNKCPCCYGDEDEPLNPVVLINVTTRVLIQFLSNHLYGDDGGISSEDLKKLDLKGNVCIENMTYMYGDGCLLGKKLWIALDGVKEQ